MRVSLVHLIKAASAGIVAAALFHSAPLLAADDKAAPQKKEENGKYFLPDGTPTYNVKPDGTVDWYTFSGFRRYHSECHVCHGPDGLGSSYAPNLTESLKTLSYEDFQMTVINGKKDVNASQNKVMPAFGTNKNVFCYLDDIYIYLKARSDGAVGRGRPAKKDPFPQAAKQYESECMG